MTERISTKIKYFISASLSVLLTIASLYYAFQWYQTVDYEDNIQEQIWSVEDRLRNSDERIRCTEEYLWNMDERICYVEGKHSQRAYNQRRVAYNQRYCVQEEDHGSREYNSQEVHDSQNQDSDQDYNEECDQGQAPNQDLVSSSRSDQEQDEGCYQNEQKHVRTSVKTPRSLIIPKLD